MKCAALDNKTWFFLPKLEQIFPSKTLSIYIYLVLEPLRRGIRVTYRLIWVSWSFLITNAVIVNNTVYVGREKKTLNGYGFELSIYASFTQFSWGHCLYFYCFSSRRSGSTNVSSSMKDPFKRLSSKIFILFSQGITNLPLLSGRLLTSTIYWFVRRHRMMFVAER